MNTDRIAFAVHLSNNDLFFISEEESMFHRGDVREAAIEKFDAYVRDRTRYPVPISPPRRGRSTYRHGLSYRPPVVLRPNVRLTDIRAARAR